MFMFMFIRDMIRFENGETVFAGELSERDLFGGKSIWRLIKGDEFGPEITIEGEMTPLKSDPTNETRSIYTHHLVDLDPADSQLGAWRRRVRKTRQGDVRHPQLFARLFHEACCDLREERPSRSALPATSER